MLNRLNALYPVRYTVLLLSIGVSLLSLFVLVATGNGTLVFVASTALAMSRNMLRLSWLMCAISSDASADSSRCVMPSMARDSTDTRRTMLRATQAHNSNKASSNKPVVTTSFVTY